MTWSSEGYWSVPHKPFLWQNRQNQYMKNSLPHLTLIWAVCATAVATAQAVPQAALPAAVNADAVVRGGDGLVVQAISQLERRKSVTARLRHQVTIGGAQLYGVGSYWQQGSGENLRVRLELEIAGQDAKLLQVSNGRFLWIDRRLPTGRTVTGVDLRKLRTDPVLAAADVSSIQPGQASWSPIQPDLTANCGGLPSLLAALGENFAFLPPQARRLAVAPPLATEAINIPVFAVVGHWNPEKLAALIPPAAQPPEAAARQLPDRLPQEVLLLVGQADLFPYRVEYRRLETPRPATADGSTIPYQLSASPLAVLELSDVEFDQPIEGGQFDYNSGDVDWKDQTAQVLERLRKQRQTQLANRASGEQSR
jgi:hypothetical protein